MHADDVNTVGIERRVGPLRDCRQRGEYRTPRTGERGTGDNGRTGRTRSPRVRGRGRTDGDAADMRYDRVPRRGGDSTRPEYGNPCAHGWEGNAAELASTNRRFAVETMIGIAALLIGIGVLWVCFAFGVYLFTRTGREGVRIAQEERRLHPPPST